MTAATAEGYYGPDPDDIREPDEFTAIWRRIDDSTVTEPFAEGYRGKVLPLDHARYSMLRFADEHGYFDEPPNLRDMPGMNN